MRVGDRLAPLRKPPVTLDQLTAYQQAVGAVNPIHVDEEAARAAGFPGPIAHGMLTMGFLGQYVVGLAGPEAVRRLQTRFTALVLVGDELTCSGTVRAIEDGRARLELAVENQRCETVAAGEAEVDLD